MGSNKDLAAVHLWSNGQRKTFLIHKLYAEAFGVSVKDAYRVVYYGFNGNANARYNINRWLMEKIMECEKLQEQGEDWHDEILYLKEFLQML